MDYVTQRIKPVYLDLAEAVDVAQLLTDSYAEPYAVYSLFPPIITVRQYNPCCNEIPIYIARLDHGTPTTL